MLLLCAGALVGLAVNAVRPDGVPLVAMQEPTQCAVAAEPLELDPHDVVDLCTHGGVVVADARPTERFAQGHVAGAVHLPCDASGVSRSAALSYLDEAHMIIVYGDSTDEARPVAASLAARHPDKAIGVLRGGFEAWSAAGQACASGPCADCMDHHPAELP